VRHRLTVALSPAAPRQARDSFDTYTGRIEETLLDELRLLSSEIVTNAVVHSGRPDGDPIELTTTLTPSVIRVEVRDLGVGVDPLEPRSSHPPSGLGYVDLLSDRWSSTFDAAFHVWFEIDVESNAQLERKRTP
jgi:anti-sigma regulatory factor (Ser/Thr protein kinase)